MGNIINLGKFKRFIKAHEVSDSVGPNSVTPVQSRRRAYVLRQFSKPGTFVRVEAKLLPTESSAFERALRLHDQDDLRARTWYKLAIESGDCVADAWCNLGILESGEGWKSKAIQCFRKAILVEPRHFEAHFHLGNLFFDSGNFSEARIHYRIAEDISADHPPLMHQQAMIMLMERQYGEAINLLKRYANMVDEASRQRAMGLIQRIRGTVAMDGT